MGLPHPPRSQKNHWRTLISFFYRWWVLPKVPAWGNDGPPGSLQHHQISLYAKTRPTSVLQGHNGKLEKVFDRPTIFFFHILHFWKEIDQKSFSSLFIYFLSYVLTWKTWPGGFTTPKYIQCCLTGTMLPNRNQFIQCYTTQVPVYTMLPYWYQFI